MSQALQPASRAYGGSLRDLTLLNLVVLAWGFTSILGKLISIPAVEVTVWRTGFAAIGLLLICRFRSLSLIISRRDALAFLGTGVIIGWHWATFFLSARLSTASVCLAAMPTGMLWCSLIEPLVNRTRKWSKVELVTGLVTIVAVWIIYRFEFRHWLGFTVGLTSAFLAAIFGVMNKQLTTRHPPAVMCCYQMVGACISCLALLPFLSTPTFALPAGMDWLWLVLLSQVCTVAAYVGYLDVLRRVSVFTVNVVYNLEPVYGILMAAIIFGEKERMSGGFYFGATIIVASVVALPVMNRLTANQNAVSEEPPATSGLP